MGRAGVSEQPTSDDGTGDAGSHHRRRTIHLSLQSNKIWSKCGLHIVAKMYHSTGGVMGVLKFLLAQTALCWPRGNVSYKRSPHQSTTTRRETA